jgi:hypothetical protein
MTHARGCSVWVCIAAVFACNRAFCASHVEPCARIPNDYEERVERLMRAGWPEEIPALAILYLPLTERAVGVTRGADGFNLVRLQFDKSFWYSSWRDVEPGAEPSIPPDVRAIARDVYRADGRALGAQVLDFSRTRVRLSTLAVPISDRLGMALLQAFERSAESAKPAEKTGEISLDGYKFEVMVANHACVQVANSPPGSEAGKIDRLIRLLDNESLAWRPWEQAAFEAKVTEAIPD